MKKESVVSYLIRFTVCNLLALLIYECACRVLNLVTGGAIAMYTGMLESSGVDKWTNINRFSYGAGIGVGIQLWVLQVTAQYTWNLGKLSNVKNTSISDFNDKNFGGYVITAALMFGKKKDKKN